MISPNLQHQSERLRQVIKTAKDNFYSGAEIWAKCRLPSIGERGGAGILLRFISCHVQTSARAQHSDHSSRDEVTLFSLNHQKLGQTGSIDI